ncbi:MAG: DUF4956 domain-containing protein [Oscillospiraceae bacterium]|nr:DUF4956 domain-containing protein [Oscillospiraceae bacterium]
MSFTDMIKKSVLEQMSPSNLGTSSIVVTLALAVALGLFIYFVYRFNSKSGFYQRDFNKSLATLPAITAAIILAMGTNLTISLGMVGALSIVRFRNAVKNPMDLSYLFWSISTGIVIGAGLVELALIMSLVVAVLLSLLDLLPGLRSPGLLVVCGSDIGLEAQLVSIAKEHSRVVKIRSRNVSAKQCEWIFELQLKNEAELLEKISALEAVRSAHLMSHDGELRF